MRVLWINEKAAVTGGTERYVLETACGLKRFGVESTLLYDVESEVSSELFEAFDGVFPVVELSRQVRSLRPDLIYVHHLHDESLIDNLLAYDAPTLRFFHDHGLFCLRTHKYFTLNRKTCTRTTGLGCYHCLGFLNKQSAWPGVTVVPLSSLTRLQRKNQELAGCVVGSQYMRDHVVAHGFEPARVHKIPLYTALPSVADLTASHTISSTRDPRLMLFVGSLITGKGLDLLFEAMTRLPRDVRLVVVGTGRQEAKIRAHSQTLGLSARVEFVGVIAPSEVAKFFARAGCLVMPSREPETFGLAGLEAMAHGLPVVASRVGGISEWLAHEHTGLLVPPCDPLSLAAALLRVVSDTGLAHRLGEAGAVHARLFNADAHITALYRLFERTINQHGAHESTTPP